MSRWRRPLWIVVVAVLAGCTADHAAPDRAAGQDPLRAQAREALDRYDRTAGAGRLLPIGDLTRQLGDWEAGKGEQKRALAAGRVTAAAPLPGAPGEDGTVAWEDGTSMPVTLAPAAEALARLVAAGAHDCPECVPLRVTGATLTTGPIQTSRGPATAPVWEFTLKGTAVRLTRPAIADAAIAKVTPPSWDPDDPPAGLAISAATAVDDGRRLSVEFTGAPAAGDVPCGADYTAEEVESEHAVVVIVRADEPGAAPGEACPAIGASRSATVDLARPLGTRAVLEVREGLPVPVT